MNQLVLAKSVVTVVCLGLLAFYPGPITHMLLALPLGMTVFTVRTIPLQQRARLLRDLRLELRFGGFVMTGLFSLGILENFAPYPLRRPLAAFWLGLAVIFLGVLAVRIIRTVATGVKMNRTAN